MNEYDIKRLAAILSIQAEIEGMKADNTFRFQQEWTPNYGSDSFNMLAEQLRQLATVSNDNLADFINSLS